MSNLNTYKQYIHGIHRVNTPCQRGVIDSIRGVRSYLVTKMESHMIHMGFKPTAVRDKWLEVNDRNHSEKVTTQSECWVLCTLSWITEGYCIHDLLHGHDRCSLSLSLSQLCSERVMLDPYVTGQDSHLNNADAIEVPVVDFMTKWNVGKTLKHTYSY